MVHVTLVGDRQAATGREFVYAGPQPECRPCRVKAACLNQEVGRRYRILRIRDVVHPCLLNEEGARVVEVDPSPPECSLPVRSAVEGALATYEPLVCANAACANYRLCHPVGIPPGVRLKIVAIGAELDCPLGYAIVPARVVYADGGSQ